MHRDHVPLVPHGFHNLGSSPTSPIQGLVRLYPSSMSSDPAAAATEPARMHILTVQGHPEFTGDIVSAIIDAREKSGAMSADAVQAGRERAFLDHEGIGAIGRAIWRVLGVDAPPAPA